MVYIFLCARYKKYEHDSFFDLNEHDSKGGRSGAPFWYFCIMCNSGGIGPASMWTKENVLSSRLLRTWNELT